jgi:hypothetical protein
MVCSPHFVHLRTDARRRGYDKFGFDICCVFMWILCVYFWCSEFRFDCATFPTLAGDGSVWTELIVRYVCRLVKPVLCRWCL